MHELVSGILALVGTLCMWHASRTAYAIDSPWGKVASAALLGLMLVIAAAWPPKAAAHIVTCREAGAIMADYAEQRDLGKSYAYNLRDLNRANKGGSVSNIQMDRLRYDLRGLYEDYVLMHASPQEIAALYRKQCPNEFAP